MDAGPLIATAAAAVIALMLGLWLLHFPLRNAAIVDAGWAGGLALIAILYAVLGEGWGPRRWLMAMMAVAWGLRLSLYLLLTRVIGQPEEGRYAELRRKWKSNIGLKFLIFYEAQALLCVLLSWPYLAPALDPEAGFRWNEFLGVSLFLFAIAGEVLADGQLARFKIRTASPGKTCRAGLWRYSRHPNYFFEWLIWMSWAIYAAASPRGWLAFLSPALILYFLLRVTGIPATEAQALRTKGDDYREYQRTTSAFVPWLRKRA